MTGPVCFVDTETTGLDPDRHEIWEVGLITPDGEEHQWFLPVDESRADLIALNIGGYFDRYPPMSSVTWEATFAREFQRLTRGLHLAGAVVSFDADRLHRLMVACDVIPAWHYHLIDVETLAVGYLSRMRHQQDGLTWGHGCAIGDAFDPAPPWSSDRLSRFVGVDPDDFDRHTALGDARWAKAIYEKCLG